MPRVSGNGFPVCRTGASAVLDERPQSDVLLKDLSGRDSPVASCARVSIDLQGRARKPLNRGYRKYRIAVNHRTKCFGPTDAAGGRCPQCSRTVRKTRAKRVALDSIHAATVVAVHMPAASWKSSQAGLGRSGFIALRRRVGCRNGAVSHRLGSAKLLSKIPTL